MAIASTSCTQDQFSTHAKRMLHLNDKLYNDSLLSSSRCFAEFDHDPQSSFSPLVSVEDPQQRFAGMANVSDIEKRFFPESIAALYPGTSAVSSDIAHEMQGRMRSYHDSQHLPTVNESFGPEWSGRHGSLDLNNELSDFWGDFLLHSPTHAVLPAQKFGWNEASTSCTTSGDLLTTTISVEFDRPSGQGSCGYPMPTMSETSARQGTDLGCPRPLQPENNHSSRPVATSVTSVGLDSTLTYHGSALSSEDMALPLKLSHQLQLLGKTVSPRPRPSTGQKSRVYSQSPLWDRVPDAAVVKRFIDEVDDSKVTPGSRPHNFLQRRPSLSISSSPDYRRRGQPGECGTGDKAHQFTSGNLNPLKLKQKSKEQSAGWPRPRKYQKGRADDGNDLTNEVNRVPTVFDHVQRERQRRDLMTSKIAALELLLPKSFKRDRVTIVYDAIQLLKRLEQDVKVLQQKFLETKLRRAKTAPSARHRQSLDQGKNLIPKSNDCDMRTNGNCLSNRVVIKCLGTYMKPIATFAQPTWGPSGKSRPTKKSSIISSVQCLGNRQILDKGDVFVEFHVHLDDTAKVQEEKVFKCRCRMDYLSTMMGLVDEFQLDVMSCNIVKLSGYFICVMGLKTRTRKETMTAAQFAVRLQSAVDVDILREAVTISLSGAKLSDSIEK